MGEVIDLGARGFLGRNQKQSGAPGQCQPFGILVKNL